MSKHLLAGAVTAAMIAGLFGSAAAAQQKTPAPAAAPAPTPTVADHRAVVTKYCVTCHNARLKTGNLVLDPAALENVPANAAVWEKVIRKLAAGAMPPAGSQRPEPAVTAALQSYLEGTIDREAAARPNPGRTEALHRLNRTEYQNAIRDLLSLQVDASALVPADDQSYGFDNIAGVLKISPTLLDRYMTAAREIASLAVGATPREPVRETFMLRSDLAQHHQMEGLPFGTRGGTSIQYIAPRDGDYTIKVELLQFVVGSNAIREPHDLEIAVDGERIQTFTLKPKGLAYQEMLPDYQVRLPLKAGPRTIMATFVKKTYALNEGLRKPFDRPHGEGDYLYYQPFLSSVTVTGPYDAKGADDTPSRNRIFVCKPSGAADEGKCARQILSTLARRAYRRPVTDADVQPLFRFYEEGRAGANFDAGIEKAVRAVLVSPDFLFRVEVDPPNVPAGQAYRLGDSALASRLSFFLWSSIPDDQLLDLASKGQLKTPAVLEQQVRRMLKDPRSEALASTFAGQWLRLRNITGVQPNNVKYPNFSDNLRRDFVRETEMLFDSIVREDRSILDLLNADYTFVNERLAKYYGIDGVYGNDFKRVSLADQNRRGLLGQGSILLVTSYPDRTSPVLRGKWILENVLGTPPPPPPANVPDLKENGNGVTTRALTMRERMAGHRSNPVCASCHRVMDPLGLAMENFDAVGRWRSVDEGGDTVDSSGAMPDGTAFKGPAGLRALLVKNPEAFSTVVAEKLMVYALGRGVEHHDGPALRKIVRGAAASDYQFASLVVGLVTSPPFTMRMVADTRVQ